MLQSQHYASREVYQGTQHGTGLLKRLQHDGELHYIQQDSLRVMM